MIRCEDTFMFQSSGRQFRAHGNIIGIGQDGCIYDRYDGCPFSWDGKDALSEEENTELCDYMIALWTKRKTEK